MCGEFWLFDSAMYSYHFPHHVKSKLYNEHDDAMWWRELEIFDMNAEKNGLKVYHPRRISLFETLNEKVNLCASYFQRLLLCFLLLKYSFFIPLFNQRCTGCCAMSMFLLFVKQCYPWQNDIYDICFTIWLNHSLYSSPMRATIIMQQAMSVTHAEILVLDLHVLWYPADCVNHSSRRGIQLNVKKVQ